VGERSASLPGRFLPPGKTRCPLYRRLGGPQDRSEQVRKISPPPGFDPRTVQPVAQSLYLLSYPAHFGEAYCLYIQDTPLKLKAAGCSKLGMSSQIYMALYPSGLEVHQKISTELTNCLHWTVAPLFKFVFPCGRHSSVRAPTRLRPG
jgi:hypothetical protein